MSSKEGGSASPPSRPSTLPLARGVCSPPALLLHVAKTDRSPPRSVVVDAPAARTAPATRTHGPNPLAVRVELADATRAVNAAARSSVRCRDLATTGGPLSAKAARTVAL